MIEVLMNRNLAVSCSTGFTGTGMNILRLFPPMKTAKLSRKQGNLEENLRLKKNIFSLFYYQSRQTDKQTDRLFGNHYDNILNGFC